MARQSVNNIVGCKRASASTPAHSNHIMNDLMVRVVAEDKAGDLANFPTRNNRSLISQPGCLLVGSWYLVCTYVRVPTSGNVILRLRCSRYRTPTVVHDISFHGSGSFRPTSKALFKAIDHCLWKSQQTYSIQDLAKR